MIQITNALEKRVYFISVILFGAAAFLSVVFGGYWSFSKEESVAVVETKAVLDIHQLGHGALSLEYGASSIFRQVLQELVLMGINTRPDHDRVFSLAIRSTGEQKEGVIGETIFLQQDEGGLKFSTIPTVLSFVPDSLEEDSLWCRIQQGDISEKHRFSPSAIFSKTLTDEVYLEVLKKGSMWGADLFLTGWGGEEYQDLARKTKISIWQDVYFLKVGDSLWWNGEKWVDQVADENVLQMPMARLVGATSEGADFQVWDETGFAREVAHLPAKYLMQASIKMEELITTVRPRSPSEITCQLGKRRVILKEGDWWIRTEDRWKSIRSVADLEACLHHQILGELFIFDKVEISKGKVTLQARAFDQMRTSSKPVSLVVHLDKKPVRLAKRRAESPKVLIAKRG